MEKIRKFTGFSTVIDRYEEFVGLIADCLYIMEWFLMHWNAAYQQQSVLKTKQLITNQSHV